MSLAPKVSCSATDSFTELVAKRYQGIASSVLCEEAIEVAKSSRKRLIGKRLRKPEAIMRSVLASDLQTQRHKYNTVQVDSLKAKKADVLSRSAFQPSKERRSLPFDELVSTCSAADYVLVAERPGDFWRPPGIVEHLPDFLKASQLWLDKLFNVRHGFCF